MQRPERGADLASNLDRIHSAGVMHPQQGIALLPVGLEPTKLEGTTGSPEFASDLVCHVFASGSKLYVIFQICHVKILISSRGRGKIQSFLKSWKLPLPIPMNLHKVQCLTPACARGRWRLCIVTVARCIVVALGNSSTYRLVEEVR